MFLDGLLDDERRKTGWMRAEAAGDPALRKAYVALFASEVAVDQESIRISGSSQLLERAIGRTEPATMGMVPIFDRNWCGTQSEANQSGGSRGARSQFSLIFADPPAFFALTVGLSARRFGTTYKRALTRFHQSRDAFVPLHITAWPLIDTSDNWCVLHND